jgi:hypothetical protein
VPDAQIDAMGRWDDKKTPRWGGLPGMMNQHQSSG